VHARKFYFAGRRNSKAITLPPVPWFHNPIHDLESAWWIAVWAFCYLEHWVSDSVFTDNTQRAPIILLPGNFENECTGLPIAILEPLDQWLTFMREKYTELGKRVLAGTHLSFNYDEVFNGVIGFIEEIIDALSKIQDPPLDTEERASKRRKANN
jgi:hypothetical protein